jgi:uncharacterized RDD family membrane protein YckC
MEIEDRYVTATPEGVSFSFVLAGLGSRASAYLIDIVIQWAFILVLFFVLERLAVSTTSAYVALGIFALIYFIVTFGYFVAFEMLDSGKSLGKRALGIRVTRVDGSGVKFGASLVRNLMRVLYAFPLFYLLDGGLILGTEKNQRLGDLLAGTIVVRYRLGEITAAPPVHWSDSASWTPPQAGPWQVATPPPWVFSGAPPAAWPGAAPPPAGPPPAGAWQQPPAGAWQQPPAGAWQQPAAGAWPQPGWLPALPPELESWDVTAVTQADVALVSAFLSRRFQYEAAARQNLALSLAGQLWPKVAGPTIQMDPERFLEAVAMVKSARG